MALQKYAIKNIQFLLQLLRGFNLFSFYFLYTEEL